MSCVTCNFFLAIKKKIILKKKLENLVESMDAIEHGLPRSLRQRGVGQSRPDIPWEVHLEEHVGYLWVERTKNLLFKVVHDFSGLKGVLFA